LEQPLTASQVPALWHWSEAVQVTGVPAVQAPCWQVSPWVQALPSLQAEPSALAWLEQVPVVGSQTPTWHGSEPAQVTGVPAWQTPAPSHVSAPLQAVPSEQEVPAATGV